jgi:choline dehydrogenase
MEGRFDYVIVGAGSAGCVLARRLTEDPATRVLLLEAGGADRHPYIQAPAGFIKTFQNPRYNWCYTTEPVPGAAGRAIFFPRGKVLGGSSAINGSLYVRGQARDFDLWAQSGCYGWSYEDVLPYFRRSEDRSAGADAFRGAGGPQHVSDIPERHPICEAFIEAVASLGVPRNPDYNGATQEGVAYYQRTIRNGRRHSAATGYLHAIRNRKNLCLVTGAHVLRLEVDEGRGDRRDLPARRRIAAGQPGAGDAALRGGDQLAASAAGLRDRPGVAPAGERDHARARPAGRRGGAAGPLRDAGGAPGRRGAEPKRARAWAAACVGDRRLARRRKGAAFVQPGPCWRLHPLARGARGARPAVRIHTSELFRRRDRPLAALPRDNLRGLADAAA